MCGRVALFSPPARLARLVGAVLGADLDLEGHPRWNVAPSQVLYAARMHDEVRTLERYRWGLVPSWAKDPSIANRLFNARAETIAEKPSFRSAFATRPCVVPLDGFYEWDHRAGHHRQPHYFQRVDAEPMVLAGLYERWRDPHAPSAGAVVSTCTIITTAPNVDMDGLHDRMPVVLEPNEINQWLNVTDYGPDERMLLLHPARKGTLAHYGVDPAVGSVHNEGPGLIAPGETQSLF